MLLLQNFLKSNVALKTEYCLNGKNISTRKFIIIQYVDKTIELGLSDDARIVFIDQTLY